MADCLEIASLAVCSVPASYIRPDKGSAIMPWVILLALVLAHIVALLIRCFSKWESSQFLSISLALFGVVTVSLGYASTKFDPQQIYTWSPIGLGLDVSSNLHLMILIWNHRNEEREKGEKNWSMLCFALVLITLLALIALQLAGAGEALAKKHSTLMETWCSPALLIGNEAFSAAPHCVDFLVDARSAMGVSCIEAPGSQPVYLSLTGAIVLIQVLLEVVDFVLIFSAPEPAFNQKPRGFRQKYTAPWITITVALIVAAGMIGFGVMQTTAMPAGMSQGPVGIVSQVEGVCQTFLSPGGLRGTIIAWCDGVFGGLGKAYSPDSLA